jgi:hypothetical protein
MVLQKSSDSNKLMMMMDNACSVLKEVCKQHRVVKHLNTRCKTVTFFSRIAVVVAVDLKRQLPTDLLGKHQIKVT